MEDNNVVYINPSPSADTRSAVHKVTKNELIESTRMHIGDVRRGLHWMVRRLQHQGLEHDWTKLKYIDEFYDQFSRAQETGDWGTGWYDQIHLKKERHHLDDIDSCPDDVNLLDVLEQIVDGVMAGMARTGRYEPRPVDPSILSRAYDNTCKMMAGAVRVVGADKAEKTKWEDEEDELSLTKMTRRTLHEPSPAVVWCEQLDLAKKKEQETK